MLPNRIKLLIFGYFDDTVRGLDYVAPGDRTVSGNKLETIRIEDKVTSFQPISRYFLNQMWKTHKFIKNSEFPDPDLTVDYSEHAGVLPSRSQSLVNTRWFKYDRD